MEPYGGTILIAGVSENKQLAGIGLCCVRRVGSTRESEQVMKNARED
jgi:hypothetical protein